LDDAERHPRGVCWDERAARLWACPGMERRNGAQVTVWKFDLLWQFERKHGEVSPLRRV